MEARIMQDEPQEIAARGRELRHKALELLARRHGKIAEMPVADVQTLVHELEVYQVELEVQNEELRRAQAAAEAAVERYRDLFDRAPVGYLILDREHRILQANEAGARLCSRGQSELEGAEWESLVIAEDREKAWLLLRRVAGTGLEQAGEFRVHRAAGAPLWVSTHVSALRLGERGSGFRVTLADITSRVQAQEIVEESEARFRLMADGTPLLIWVTDTEGRNEFVNQAFREFFKVEPESVRGSGWEQLVHEEDRSAYLKAAMAALRAERSFRAEARVRRHDGQWRWIESRGEPRFASTGRFLGLVGCSADITERKVFQLELERLVTERTSRLQEMVGELEHFSYTITHDLKSPLRAMKGFAELLKHMIGEDAKTEAREALERISHSAERMECLIGDALSYSRAVRQELPLTDVDTGALLRGILDSYPEFQACRANIRVEGELPVILGNEAGLTQCFSNLLGNAVKFVRPRIKPEVRVWAEMVKHDARGRGGQWTRIWVEDKGIGISREMRARLFDMFSRGSKDYDGTGIGLALVRKVVQRMGGKVGVESEEGKGSRFWLELKCGERKANLVEAGGKQAIAGAAAPHETVLYVEDEESDAMFMARAFAELGMERALRVVTDGREALGYLSGSGKYADREEYPLPAVVLLDLNLPQVPGFEVLKWMRNHPDFARTPVVVFSSSTRQDDQVMARELGANDFVTKPSSGMQFGRVVELLKERWLGRISRNQG